MQVAHRRILSSLRCLLNESKPGVRRIVLGGEVTGHESQELYPSSSDRLGRNYPLKLTHDACKERREDGKVEEARR